ncbi:MAG: site-specific DNA-methyltransferase [Candidatus Marinimicrobia bacterium]|nr:site-specific DNA-methyltransferase [Candidatus Neomarinimicrobiota bacterium]
MIKYDSINYGNFFELYQQIQPCSVGLFLADLPYNLFDDNRLSGLPNDKRVDLNELETALDYLLTDSGQAVLFCNLNLLIRIKSEFGKYITFKHHHILQKSMAMPGNQFYPLNDSEFLAVCYRTGAKISDLCFNPHNGSKGNPYSKKNYNLDGCKIRRQSKPQVNVNESGQRHIKTIIPMTSKCNLDKSERFGIEHPFQKPVKLLRQLIRAYSNPGDFVCDGFAGSGSTLIASEMERRRYVGFEIDHKYYLEGLGRVEREKCIITLPF